jgi:ketosteroid isomerase-like protein
MANPNVALVYEALGAYQTGDLERLRELFDPEIEIVGGNGLINTGTYRGFDGFLDWIAQWEEAWDPVTYDLRDVVEVTDSLFVVAVHTVGRGAASGNGLVEAAR